jgi:hypothetical protein
MLRQEGLARQQLWCWLLLLLLLLAQHLLCSTFLMQVWGQECQDQRGVGSCEGCC